MNEKLFEMLEEYIDARIKEGISAYDVRNLTYADVSTLRSEEAKQAILEYIQPT